VRKRDEMADPNSCLNRAKEDEYLFVLLERDLDVPGTIEDWCRRRVERGKSAPASPEIVEAHHAARLIREAQADPERIAYLKSPACVDPAPRKE
jgi:hypothetical protein